MAEPAARGGVRHDGALGARAGRPGRARPAGRGPAGVRGRAGPVPRQLAHGRGAGRPACCRSSTLRWDRSPATGPCARSRWPTGWPSWASSAAGRRRCDHGRDQRRRCWRRCCAGTCPPTDPLAGYAPSSGRPGAGRPGAARLPHRQHRRRAPGRRPRTATRAIWSWTTRPTGSGRSTGPTLTLADYTPDRLAAAMIGAHYPLQALLYAVALHRLLRWRQPGYDPDAAPRRRALPVRPRHGRAQTRRGSPACPAGCSAGVRRTGWSPSCPTCWTGAAVSTDRREVPASRPTSPLAVGGDRAAGGVQHRRRAGRRPTCTPPTPSARIGRRERRPGAAGAGPGRPRAAQRLGVHRPGHGARPTVFDEAETGVDLAELPWPEPAAWSGGLRGKRPGRRRRRPARRPAAAAGRTGCSTWSATGGRRSWSASSCSNASPRRCRRLDRSRAAAGLQRLFPGDGLADGEPDRQRLAAAVSALGWVTVLAGGPGTGKTTTVARMLALLHDQPGPPPRIALAAPTGKAAARLEEAIRAAAAGSGTAGPGAPGRPAARRPCTGCWAGARDSRSRFRPRRRQPAAARRRGGRRDVDGVADPDGPAAGGGPADRAAGAGRRPGPAVLGRGRGGAGRHRARARARRTGAWPPALAELGAAARGRAAAGARRGPAAADLAVRRRDRRSRPGDPGGRSRRWRSRCCAPARATSASSRSTSRRIRSCGPSPPRRAWPSRYAVPAGVPWPPRRPATSPALSPALDEHRLLCAHRRGPFGVARWSAEAERWLAEADPGLRRGRRVVPRPAAAGHRQRLRDGSLQRRHRRHRRGRTASCAPRSPAGRRPTLYPPVRLDAVQTVHAMTVHRAQGSQFERVSFVLPPPDSPLLTRELLYTAVTRARQRVQVIGAEAAVRRADPAPGEPGQRPAQSPARAVTDAWRRSLDRRFAVQPGLDQPVGDRALARAGRARRRPAWLAGRRG